MIPRRNLIAGSVALLLAGLPAEAKLTSVRRLAQQLGLTPPKFAREWLGGVPAEQLGLARVPWQEAAANALWSGAGVYSLARTTWLSTELNSLANSSANTLSTLGAAFQNTAAWLYYDTEFLAGSTLTPAAGAFIELWQLRSLDGGTNYEDGSASVAPGRPADITILVRAGTTITPRSGASRGILPPAFYKPIARNQTGVSLPASGNVISYVGYTEIQ